MLFSNSDSSLPGLAISRASRHQYYPPLFCFGKSKCRIVFTLPRLSDLSLRADAAEIDWTQISTGSLYRLLWF